MRKYYVYGMKAIFRPDPLKSPKIFSILLNGSLKYFSDAGADLILNYALIYVINSNYLITVFNFLLPDNKKIAKNF